MYTLTAVILPFLRNFRSKEPGMRGKAMRTRQQWGSKDAHSQIILDNVGWPTSSGRRSYGLSTRQR